MQNNYSDLEINDGNDFDFEEFDSLNPNKKSDSNDLQRTEEWHNARNETWNGSEIKGLMSCNNKGGKMSWSDKEKTYEFSDGIVKYIYEVAMKRRTKRYIESASTSAMKYGTAVEPLILKRTEQILRETRKDFTIKQVGFKLYPTVPTAGVSADAMLYDNTEKPLESVEMKACCTWVSHYDRTFERTSEKSTDFWQTQSQMIAWNVPTTIYAVAQPPRNIMKYVKADDIMELEDDWNKECDVTIEVVEASSIHQNALLKRIEIAEEIIKQWNETGRPLNEIFYEVIKEKRNEAFAQTDVDYTELEEKESKLLADEIISSAPVEIPAPVTKEQELDDVPF